MSGYLYLVIFNLIVKGWGASATATTKNKKTAKPSTPTTKPSPSASFSSIPKSPSTSSSVHPPSRRQLSFPSVRLPSCPHRPRPNRLLLRNQRLLHELQIHPSVPQLIQKYLPCDLGTLSTFATNKACTYKNVLVCALPAYKSRLREEYEKQFISVRKEVF